MKRLAMDPALANFRSDFLLKSVLFIVTMLIGLVTLVLINVV